MTSDTCRLINLYILMSLGSIATGAGVYGHGGGPVHLTSVQCAGTESRLADCVSVTASSSCTHAYDVGVRCHVQTGITNGMTLA